MELGGSEEEVSDMVEPEAEDGSGAERARAAVGVTPEPAPRTKAAVGVRPEPADKAKAAVGVRPEPACLDKAAVGVRPEPAETGTGSEEAGLVPSIFAVPVSPLAPRAGRSRAEPPALARPEAKPGGAAEEEEKMEEEDDDEPLPSAQETKWSAVSMRGVREVWKGSIFHNDGEADLEKWITDRTVIIGDFNIVQTLDDVNDKTKLKNDISRAKLVDMCVRKNLVDLWRALNPGRRRFSRAQQVLGKWRRSRIDLLLVAGDMEVIEAWSKLLPHLEPKEVNRSWLTHLPFLGTPFLQFEGRALACAPLQAAGVTRIGQVLDGEGCFDFDRVVTALKRGGVKVRAVHIRSTGARLDSALPASWRRAYCDTGPVGDSPLEFLLCLQNKTIELISVSTSVVYRLLASELGRRPAAETVWGTLFPGEDVRRMWRNLHNKHIPARAFDLDFRLRHRRIFTGVVLHQVHRELFSRTCAVCLDGDEDVAHLFWHCTGLAEFWEFLFSVLKEHCGCTLTSLTHWTALFGLPTKKTLCNTILSLARLAIWTRRNIALHEHRTVSVCTIWKTITKSHFRTLHHAKTLDALVEGNVNFCWASSDFVFMIFRLRVSRTASVLSFGLKVLMLVKLFGGGRFGFPFRFSDSMDGHIGSDLGHGNTIMAKAKGTGMVARTPAEAGSDSSLQKPEKNLKGKMNGVDVVSASVSVDGVSGEEAGEGQGGWQTVKPRSGRLAAAGRKASGASGAGGAGGAGRASGASGAGRASRAGGAGVASGASGAGGAGGAGQQYKKTGQAAKKAAGEKSGEQAKEPAAAVAAREGSNRSEEVSFEEETSRASREEKKCGVCYNLMRECICHESEEDEASERGEMELGGSEEEEEEVVELEAESGSGAVQARAAVGVIPEPAPRTKAAVGVRPEPADQAKAAVGVRPEPACVDEAAVGVRPEPADTRTGSGNSGLVPSIFAVPELAGVGLRPRRWPDLRQGRAARRRRRRKWRKRTTSRSRQPR
ncbi:uncharacterized protein V6R79_021317 [Siganus canaliculatus]